MTLRSDLATLPARIIRLRGDAELALIRLRDQIDALDGYPTSTIGAADPTAFPAPIREGRCTEIDAGHRCNWMRPCPEHDTDVPLTAVERAAAQLGPLLRHREKVIDALEAILNAVAHAERETRRHLTSDDTRKAQPGDRCNAGQGDQTAINWNIPDCTNLAAVYNRQDGGQSPIYDGLCERCYQRRRRWQAKGGEAA